MQEDDYNKKLQQIIDEGIKNGICTPTEENTLKSRIKAHANIGPPVQIPTKKDLSPDISLESIFENLRYYWKTSFFVLHLSRELHMTPKQL